MVTFDTNVAVYAVSRVTPKAATAAEVIAQSSFVSVQLLNEYANVLLRKQHLPWADVFRLLNDMRESVPSVLPMDESDHRRAVQLAQRYRVAFYDALMLAVALSGGARTFYSEDMQNGMIIEGTLTIVNPFTPGALDA